MEKYVSQELKKRKKKEEISKNRHILSSECQCAHLTAEMLGSKVSENVKRDVDLEVWMNQKVFPVFFQEASQGFFPTCQQQQQQ